MPRPTIAVHDARRCVARSVNVAGCWSVPLTTRKIRLVFFICGSPQKKFRSLANSVSVAGQGQSVAMFPSAALGIH